MLNLFNRNPLKSLVLGYMMPILVILCIACNRDDQNGLSDATATVETSGVITLIINIKGLRKGMLPLTRIFCFYGKHGIKPSGLIFK